MSSVVVIFGWRASEFSVLVDLLHVPELSLLLWLVVVLLALETFVRALAVAYDGSVRSWTGVSSTRRERLVRR